MPRPEASTARLQALLSQAGKDEEARERAYDELIRLASQRLMRLTRKMLKSYPHLQRWEQTDDVFQSAAMKLHRSLNELKPPNVAAFWGLATTQIRRTLIDLARHHFGPQGAAAHHHSVRGQALPSERREAGPAAAAKECRPETLQEWTEFHELVERLPPEEADVFHLIWYAGLQQQDIAEALKVSLPTVQRRWYAAQLRLYEWMQGQAPESGEEA